MDDVVFLLIFVNINHLVSLMKSCSSVLESSTKATMIFNLIFSLIFTTNFLEVYFPLLLCIGLYIGKDVFFATWDNVVIFLGFVVIYKPAIFVLRVILIFARVLRKWWRGELGGEELPPFEDPFEHPHEELGYIDAMLFFLLDCWDWCGGLFENFRRRFVFEQQTSADEQQQTSTTPPKKAGGPKGNCEPDSCGKTKGGSAVKKTPFNKQFRPIRPSYNYQSDYPSPTYSSPNSTAEYGDNNQGELISAAEEVSRWVQASYNRPSNRSQLNNQVDSSPNSTAEHGADNGNNQGEGSNLTGAASQGPPIQASYNYRSVPDSSPNSSSTGSPMSFGFMASPVSSVDYTGSPVSSNWGSPTSVGSGGSQFSIDSIGSQFSVDSAGSQFSVDSVGSPMIIDDSL